MFNWVAFLIWTILFTVFLLGFLFQKKGVHWRSAGPFEGFIIALFAEMFGIPLSIYILSSLFGMSDVYGSENPRIALFGKGPQQLFFMVPMFIFAIAGILLICAGWYRIYNSKDTLVVDGLYSHLRHPQYLGLMLVTLALLLWWPTVLMLVMWPILCIMYYILARREERTMVEMFGESYLDYRKRVNMLFPFIGRGKKDRS